jgi:hypothetical protein
LKATGIDEIKEIFAVHFSELIKERFLTYTTEQLLEGNDLAV